MAGIDTQLQPIFASVSQRLPRPSHSQPTFPGLARSPRRCHHGGDLLQQCLPRELRRLRPRPHHHVSHHVWRTLDRVHPPHRRDRRPPPGQLPLHRVLPCHRLLDAPAGWGRCTRIRRSPSLMSAALRVSARRQRCYSQGTGCGAVKIMAA